jgi:hypothetical protein
VSNRARALLRSRALVVAVVVVIGLAALCATYLSGGGRLESRGGDAMGGPVQVGEELHLVTRITATGGTVELLSAEAAGDLDGLDVQIRLVRLGPGAIEGSFRGPISDAYGPIDLAHHRITTEEADRWALDLRVVPTRAGRALVRSLQVTYGAGARRERTASIGTSLCILATTSAPTDASLEGCDEPG